jgi:hypothetical protein
MSIIKRVGKIVKSEIKISPHIVSEKVEEGMFMKHLVVQMIV